MRRSTLAFVTVLLVLACGDDASPLDPSEGTSSTSEATASSSGPSPTSTTIEPSTTTADSTGLVAECGNGIVEDGEDCDDANVLEDDGCYSTCMVPFEVLWTATYDAGAADQANDVDFDADGNLYVLGAVTNPGQGYDVWLRKYAPDGSESWTWTYDGALGGDDAGIGLALHPSGDLLITGFEDMEAGYDVLVMRLAVVDQTPVWTRYHAGPGTDPMAQNDYANAITSDADGNVLVTGREVVDGQSRDIWIRKYDADGNELWTDGFNNPAFNGDDGGRSVLADAAGNVYLAGVIEIAPLVDEGWVRKYDADGNELWTETTPNIEVVDAALDLDGNLVLVGLDTENGNGNLWAARYDPDFTLLSSTSYDGPSGLRDLGWGAAVGASSHVYITGQVSGVGAQSEIWTGRFTPDLGLLMWSDMYGDDEAGFDDRGHDVTVTADESRVAVAGYVVNVDDHTDVSVRVYQNNPVPGQ